MKGLDFGRWFVVLAIIFFASNVIHGAVECSWTYCPGEEEWTCDEYPEEDECIEKREQDKEPKPNVRA